MKKRTTLTFAEVEDCRFDLIAHTIREMVGKDFDNPSVTFTKSNEGFDLFFDMYKYGELFALISVFRYDEHQAYLIDYRETEKISKTTYKL